MNELFRKLAALPEQASSIAADVDHLHLLVLGTSLLGALGVALVTAFFLLRHRESGPARKGTGRGVPVWFEVVVIGGLLSMFVGFWCVGFRQYVRMRTPPRNALDVYVVAKQWMWAFAYPDGTASNVELYVPVGRPVRLLITSRDVIHSFYVPAFRIKQDAVPGRMTVSWFEATRAGSFEVLCAEYCGLSHSLMRARVVALPPEHYEEWNRQRRPEAAPAGLAAAALTGGKAERPAESLSDMGERIAAQRGCLRCHTVDGTPHLGPTWAGLYRSEVPLADGHAVLADEAYLTESMMDPALRVHAGFEPMMPSYQGVITAPEVGALVAYIRSLEGREREPRSMPLPVPTEAAPRLPTQATRARALPIEQAPTPTNTLSEEVRP